MGEYGVKGELYRHGGSTGGLWLVVPGQFSLYVATMDNYALGNDHFQNLDVMIEKFIRSSRFHVRPLGENDDAWEEIMTCGNGLYYDILPAYPFEYANILDFYDENA